MISLDNISVRFGGFTLLDNVSMMVNNRDRIGLVGKNGAGKTTTLKIISGLQQPDSGKITISENKSTAYLPQQMVHMDGKTVYHEAMEAFSIILEMESRIEEIEHELAQRIDFDSQYYLNLIDEFSVLHERFEMAGGSSIHADVEKTLIGLGFSSSDMNRSTKEFSGGWRMRLELAKILLRKPDFILLDEPTNHLDIESIQWLEDFLSSYFGGVIIISHDRAFLDNVTNRTVEISLGKLYDYKVPYSKYVILRKERREQVLATFQNQQKSIKETEDFIDRFRYKASKAVQVQSRIKQLDKINRIEIEDEDKASLNIKFPPAPRSGQIIIETTELNKSYGPKLVLNKVDLIIERGDRVAFVGRNGEGKTTLSKIIVGDLDFKGKFKLGHNVSIGYFAQNQDEILDENKTVLETFDAIAVGDIRTRIRDILGAFLFRGEDVDKKVRILSGGERSRLSMACLLLQPYNLLVLDEPTNHLDMRSKDILKSALKEYDGTLIVVSHDRDFLNGLVNKVYEFKNHKIKEHLGGIYDFLQKKKIDSLKEIERKQGVVIAKNDKPSNSKMQYEQRKEHDKFVRKLKSDLQKMEEKIGLIEKDMNTTSELLANPKNSSNKELFNNYDKYALEYDTLLNKWEKINIELDKLMKERI